MDKVDRVLQAKHEGVPLTGQREAYAAIIMHLVANELNINIKLGKIASFSGNLEPHTIQKAHKKLQQIFKEWFRN